MKEHILQFFKYEHLPMHLQRVSAPFCELARSLVSDEEHGLPRNPERTVALRKLLEAKDAAVRAQAAEIAEDEEPSAKPYDGSAKPTTFTHDVGSKEDLGFWKFNREIEPEKQIASDDELDATESVCAEIGIGIHRSLVARIIARLRAAEKSRT